MSQTDDNPLNRYTLSSLDAVATSHKALEKIQGLSLNANPVHFLLMYEWLSNIDTHLTEDIDQAISLKSYEEASPALFKQAINTIVTNSLPTKNFKNMVDTLLSGMEKWLKNHEGSVESLTTQIHAIENLDLPEDILKRLKESILPCIQQYTHDTQTLRKTIESTNNNVQQLQNELEKMTLISITDELTNLPNRRGFNQSMKSLMDEAQLCTTSFALVILDLDFFKKINDTYGHLLGDSILRFLAKFLLNETKGKDIVARIGGEEFVIVFPATDYSSAIKLTENIRKHLASKTLNVKSQKEPITITASFGVASYQMGEALDPLFDRADKALYAAKNSGRNRVVGEAAL